LAAYSAEQVALGEAIPSLDLVPRLADPPPGRSHAALAPNTATLTARQLHALLRIDGRRNVADLCDEDGPTATLRALFAAQQLGVIHLGPGIEAPPDQPSEPPPASPLRAPAETDLSVAPAAPATTTVAYAPAASLPAADTLGVTGSPAPALPAAPAVGQAQVEEAGEEEKGLRYWRRTIILALVTLALLAISWWSQQRLAGGRLGAPLGSTAGAEALVVASAADVTNRQQWVQ
jgi:hypothetical protein